MLIHLYTDGADDHREQDRLGDLLKDRRVELGLKHREVAATAGVSVSYVGMVERGERRPTASNLKAILEALDLPNMERGPHSVDFEYNDTFVQVRFKPPNPMMRLNPLAARAAAANPERVEQQWAIERERLGKLIGMFANNPAAVKVVYLFHCSGDPDLADEALPSPEAMLGELAQVLVVDKRLARQIYEQYFGEAARAFQIP